MHVSDGGLAFLVGEEGSIPYAYNDPSGFATFGVGHLIGRRRVTAQDGVQWGTRTHPKPGLVMPTLRVDLHGFEQTIDRLVTVPLNANEFDALLSLEFNIGAGGFATSSVLRRLNRGDRFGAADAFRMWSHSNGQPILAGRRERERKLFLTPVAPQGAAAWLRPDELRWVHEYDALVHISRPLTAQERRRRGVLWRVMTVRRKAIWTAAQVPGGWEVNDRRRRYNSLLSRTR